MKRLIATLALAGAALCGCEAEAVADVTLNGLVDVVPVVEKGSLSVDVRNGTPVDLMDFIAILEKHVGKKAVLNMMPMQPGDVEGTWCDVSALGRAVGYAPYISLDEGIEKTVAWFRRYYNA